MVEYLSPKRKAQYKKQHSKGSKKSSKAERYYQKANARHFDIREEAV